MSRISVTLEAHAISGLQATLFDKRLMGPAAPRMYLSNTKEASFENLPPGRYAFRARARGPYGKWGEFSAPLNFCVTRPLHQRPWFVVAVIVVLVVLAFLVHISRLRKMTARYGALQEERERIARDLHDGLGQGFTALRFHLETMRRTFGQPSAQSIGLMDESTQILRQVEDDARRTIWNLRTTGIGEQSLSASLRSLAARTAAGSSGKACKIEVEVNEACELKDAMTNAELLSVAGEAFANALVHGQAQIIHVTLDVDQSSVRLAIYDDGRGFQQDESAYVAKGHFGLLGMRERVRRLKGTLTIESVEGHGTMVVAIVPNVQHKES